jgi:hypothetical protein
VRGWEVPQAGSDSVSRLLAGVALQHAAASCGLAIHGHELPQPLSHGVATWRPRLAHTHIWIRQWLSAIHPWLGWPGTGSAAAGYLLGHKSTGKFSLSIHISPVQDASKH